eukprot:8453_1
MNSAAFMNQFAMCHAASQNLLETDQLKNAKYKKALFDVKQGKYPHVWEDFIGAVEATTRLLNGILNNTFGLNNKKQVLMANPLATIYSLGFLIEIWTDKILEFKNSDGVKASLFANKASDASKALLKLIRLSHTRDTTQSGIFGLVKQACLDLHNSNDSFSKLLDSMDYDQYRKEHFKDVKSDYRKFSSSIMNILGNTRYSNGNVRPNGRQQGRQNRNNNNNNRTFKPPFQGGNSNAKDGDIHRSFVKYKDKIPMKYLLNGSIQWNMCYQYNIKGVCTHGNCRFQNCGQCLDCGKRGCFVNQH